MSFRPFKCQMIQSQTFLNTHEINRNPTTKTASTQLDRQHFLSFISSTKIFSRSKILSRSAFTFAIADRLRFDFFLEETSYSQSSGSSSLVISFILSFPLQICFLRSLSTSSSSSESPFFAFFAFFAGGSSK